MAINRTEARTFAVDFRGPDCYCDRILDKPHRHRIQKTKKTHREAADFEKDVLAQVAKREYVRPSGKTVREIADEWYNRKVAGTYRRASLVDWKNHVGNYIKPELGNRKLSEIEIRGVKGIEEVEAEWGKRVSPKMVNKVLTTLTAILALAKRYGDIKDNPAAEAERLKIATDSEDDIEVVPDKVYSKGEVAKLICATEPGTIDRLLIMVPVLTGVRIGEALSLTWTALDLKAGKLHVRFNLADSDKGQVPILQPPKTKSSRRTVSLPVELVRELRVWKLKCPKSEWNLVFATEEGKPFRRKTASNALDRAVAKAKVKRLTPHGLRHTFASLLLADGVPTPEVSHLLGHKDSCVTMKVYAHFIGEETGAVQNLAASILAGEKG